jgi:hypothetical protein
MDIILAERNLANQKNTAQTAIYHKIQNLEVGAGKNEFILPELADELCGEVNFHPLRAQNIKTIKTPAPGKITEVYGLPPGLENFQLKNQLLVELKNIPSSLQTLHLDNNFVEELDVSKLKHLRVLSLNNNRIRRLGTLPESLEELYVDRNQISNLDLTGLRKLRILHCRNNKTLRIENVPASIVDLRVEEGNPRLVLDYDFIPTSLNDEERSARGGTEADFVEALHTYFELKAEYEDGTRDARAMVKALSLKRGLGKKDAVKRARMTKAKCVNCSRPVGTVFKTKENRLIAYCGDTKEPCALSIEIFKGSFESNDFAYGENAEELAKIKERIITQKMDVLFNYSSEDETVAKFKDLIEEYNLVAYLNKTQLDKREDDMFNSHKHELIKGKLRLIDELKATMNVHLTEYKSSGNRDSLHLAMDIYIKEYAPEIHNLRMLRHGVMDMIVASFNEREMTLNQRTVSLMRTETSVGEAPKVLKFVRGKIARVVEAQQEDEEGEEESGVIPWPSQEED